MPDTRVCVCPAHTCAQDNPNYLDRFYKADNFAAVEVLKTACGESGLQTACSFLCLSRRFNGAVCGFHRRSLPKRSLQSPPFTAALLLAAVAGVGLTQAVKTRDLP